jgi:CRISPR-associated protein Cas2
MFIYVVCYDISDDGIREAVAQELLKHGNRVQFSVFEIVVSSKEALAQLCQRLQKLADDKTVIRFYRLCQSCRDASHDLQQRVIANFPAVIII